MHSPPTLIAQVESLLRSCGWILRKSVLCPASDSRFAKKISEDRFFLGASEQFLARKNFFDLALSPPLGQIKVSTFVLSKNDKVYQNVINFIIF